MQIIVALKFVAYRAFEFENARRGIGISRMTRINSANRSVAYMFRGLKIGFTRNERNEINALSSQFSCSGKSRNRRRSLDIENPLCKGRFGHVKLCRVFGIYADIVISQVTRINSGRCLADIQIDINIYIGSTQSFDSAILVKRKTTAVGVNRDASH